MPMAQFRSACFFSVNNGTTVQRRANSQDEQQFPLPGNVTNLYRFDEKQPNNAGLLTQWESNSAVFTMAGSQVLVSGNPAEFDPPGLLFQGLENAAALFSKLENTQDALTREEQAQLGAIAFRAAGLLS